MIYIYVCVCIYQEGILCVLREWYEEVQLVQNTIVYLLLGNVNAYR